MFERLQARKEQPAALKLQKTAGFSSRPDANGGTSLHADADCRVKKAFQPLLNYKLPLTHIS